MSDIFREVEEDVRKERFEKWWKAWGDYVIAGMAVLILGVAGYQLWLRYESSQRAKAAVEFSNAQKLNDAAKAQAAFANLAKTAPSGYALVAKLAEADAMPAAGKLTDAIALYKDIADSDKGAIGAAARLRAAWLLVDTTPKDYLVTLLAPINTPKGAWQQMAEEVLAYADYKAGHIQQAGAEFTSLANDPDSPDALKSRAKVFAAFIKEGGAANFGDVPPPSAAPAPGTPPGPSPAPPTAAQTATP